MRILIVEDESEIRNFIRENLVKEGYTVDTAKDGKDGSYLARTNDYDMIVLDFMMPGKTGLEVIEDIRKEGMTTPILVLSVKSETTNKVDLLNAGADDYLTKPFAVEELSARIRALLRRPQKLEGQVFHVGDLVIDADRHLVIRAGKEIRLTRKEFSLLKYLAKNMGTALSRSMIMEHVWDIGIDPFSNTIEAHITSLRKKIDRDHKDKLIQTISGRGYKIDNPR